MPYSEFFKEWQYLQLADAVFQQEIDFDCAAQALNYHRDMNNKEEIEIISLALEKFPGTGAQDLEKWMNLVSKFVE